MKPITRKEKLIAGEELTPITREEMFLKKYGGGADWNASEGEAGYVKGRTHYEAEELVSEPLNITWDGNTEGLVSVGDMFFKVSDAVLTDEQIASATVVNSVGESFAVAEQEVLENTADFVIYDGFAFVRKENVTAMGQFTFAETGIYLMWFGAGLIYTNSLTTTEPVEHTKTVVKKLDKKFLPNVADLDADWLAELKTALGIS